MDLLNQILYNLLEVHPIHTLVVHFPIALTSAGLFFILLALWRRSDKLEWAAFANISLATISTLVAGLTGLIDNNRTYDGAAPNSNLKIILAAILLAVSSLVAIARWRNPKLFHSPWRLLYIGGYFACFALVAVLGFLGGIILYGFHEVPAVPVTGNVLSASQSVTIPTPPSETAAVGISFAGEVMPILKNRCVNCHGGQKTEEGLDLTSYDALMAGSENGPVVIPGDADTSLLAQTLFELEMPKRGPKLSPDQTQTIIDWIDQGASNN